MAKTSNVFARVEPEVKEQAEQVLTDLGIPMSNAINLYLRQIVIQGGIPFEVKRSKSRLTDLFDQLGAWEDPRSDSEIIDDIYSSRIERAEVSL